MCSLVLQVEVCPTGLLCTECRQSSLQHPRAYRSHAWTAVGFHLGQVAWSSVSALDVCIFCPKTSGGGRRTGACCSHTASTRALTMICLKVSLLRIPPLCRTRQPTGSLPVFHSLAAYLRQSMVARSWTWPLGRRELGRGLGRTRGEKRLGCTPSTDMNCVTRCVRTEDQTTHGSTSPQCSYQGYSGSGRQCQKNHHAWRVGGAWLRIRCYVLPRAFDGARVRGARQDTDDETTRRSRPHSGGATNLPLGCVPGTRPSVVVEGAGTESSRGGGCWRGGGVLGWGPTYPSRSTKMRRPQQYRGRVCPACCDCGWQPLPRASLGLREGNRAPAAKVESPCRQSVPGGRGGDCDEARGGC